MIFFHVDRYEQLSEGTDIKLNDSYQGIKLVDDFFPDGLSRAGEVYLNDCNIEENKYIPYKLMQKLRELDFEYVRRLYFPKYPSRYQSFFGVLTLDEAIKWVEHFQCKEKPHIWQMHSEKNGLLLDANWRDKFYCNSDKERVYSGYEEYQYAFNYWEGISSEEPRFEIVVPLVKNRIQAIKKIDF